MIFLTISVNYKILNPPPEIILKSPLIRFDDSTDTKLLREYPEFELALSAALLPFRMKKHVSFRLLPQQEKTAFLVSKQLVSRELSVQST